MHLWAHTEDDDVNVFGRELVQGRKSKFAGRDRRSIAFDAQKLAGILLLAKKVANGGQPVLIEHIIQLKVASHCR